LGALQVELPPIAQRLDRIKSADTFCGYGVLVLFSSHAPSKSGQESDPNRRKRVSHTLVRFFMLGLGLNLTGQFHLKLLTINHVAGVAGFQSMLHLAHPELRRGSRLKKPPGEGTGPADSLMTSKII
jgi:hypothetical protein